MPAFFVVLGYPQMRHPGLEPGSIPGGQFPCTRMTLERDDRARTGYDGGV